MSQAPAAKLVLFSISEITSLAKHRNVFFHTDAVQSISTMELNLKENSPEANSTAKIFLYFSKTKDSPVVSDRRML